MNATEAKRRVLAVYPFAQTVFGYRSVEVRLAGSERVIGRGNTPDEAWIAAVHAAIAATKEG